MRRTFLPAMIAVLALPGCKIERTPPELLQRQDPAAEREEAAEELRARLSVFGQALGTGEPEEAVEALAPVEEVQMIGLDGRPERIEAGVLPGMLRTLIPAPPVEVRLEDVAVTLSPDADAAWFAAVLNRLAAADSASPLPPLRVTGVLVRDEGAWRLVQAHISETAVRDSQPPQPSPAAGPEDG